MNDWIKFYWPSYRLFPYERRLAKREVRVLLGEEPRSCSEGLRIPARAVNGMLERLTYFDRVSVAGGVRTPLQTRLERTAVNGRGIAPPPTGSPRAARQRTRYSAHGLHEYRGKFNPQIVRAIGNLLGLPFDAWVLDPFCGSGTTLLECAHIGWNAVGFDLNPLAVFIARTKVAALKLASDALEGEAARLGGLLLRVSTDLDFNRAFGRAESRRLAAETRAPNHQYLERWFTPSVLLQLERIDQEARRLRQAVVTDLARLVLSDLLRAVSLQDPGDLRIRRRKDAKVNYPVIPLFLSALKGRVQAILAARAVLERVSGLHLVAQADARLPLSEQLPAGTVRKKFDGAITSPPYATALPYIDTQRLSLAFLGLAGENELAALERELIGNREIDKRERAEDEARILAKTDALPPSVTRLCRTTLSLVHKSTDGFRRQNMPALLYRYFSDMARVFANVRSLVRPGGYFALVVGSNRTTLGGHAVTIDTPRLLKTIAEHAGWRPVELMRLDAYQRYDVHQKNSIRAEKLLLLQR